MCSFRYNTAMDKNIIIIGGGASALMLASLLPKKTATIIESNPKLALGGTKSLTAMPGPVKKPFNGFPVKLTVSRSSQYSGAKVIMLAIPKL